MYFCNMGNYDFNKDIHLGEAGEVVVVEDLKTLGVEFISDNKDNKYDVLMKKNGKEITYEIKTDVFCRPDSDTGNLFIEFECRGKKSGIEVTQADLFVTYYKHLREIWYIRTSNLKDLIKDNDFKVTEFSGDTDSNTKGYLIPRYQFKPHFIVRNVKRK